MALELGVPQPPEQGPELIGRHAPFLLAEGGASGRSAPGIKAYRFARPHPLYSLKFDDFNQDIVGSLTEPSGWQYLILDGDVPVASAEIGQREPDKEWIFTVLRGRSFAEKIVSALLVAERLPEVAEDDYSLRFLRASDLYLRAVWLSLGKGEGSDIFIPMGRAPGTIMTERKYSEEELQAEIAALASRRRRA